MVDGQRVPVPAVVRGAEAMDVQAITDVVRGAQDTSQEPGASWLRSPLLRRLVVGLYVLLPGSLRRAVWRGAFALPWLVHRVMGSVAITSVGMAGPVRGWFLHTTVHPLSVGVGAVTPKAWVLEDGSVGPREILHLTLLMDHDVVDGADMARFAVDLVGRLELADGLPV